MIPFIANVQIRQISKIESELLHGDEGREVWGKMEKSQALKGILYLFRLVKCCKIVKTAQLCDYTKNLSKVDFVLCISKSFFLTKKKKSRASVQ